MKKILLLFILISASIIGAAQTNPTKEEIKVKDHYIGSAGVLYVGVVNDGTNRNGYAEYICMQYRYVNGIKVWKVKVTDISTVGNEHGYGIVLGVCNCSSVR